MPDFPLPPTPWTVDVDEREGMDWNNHVVSSNGHRVCFMAHAPGDQKPLENAVHLIAAAPELLGALAAIVHEHRGFQITEDHIGNARAAIAKAKGEN